MRIRKKMLAALSGAVVAGTALAAISSTGLGPASADPSHNAKLTLTADAGRLDPVARAAFGPGTGRLVVDWNKELVTLEQTPGAQPPTIHPTRSYALLQTAIYDAVVSITHADAPYAFSVVAPRNARPDAAADQAAHDTLVALFPSFAPQLNQMLGTELATIPDGPAKDAGLIAGGHTATIILALGGRRLRRHPAAPRRRHPARRLPAHATQPGRGGIHHLGQRNSLGAQLRPSVPPAGTTRGRALSGPLRSTRSRASARTAAPPVPPTRP